jgi:beta-glucanase (GH16 family)
MTLRRLLVLLPTLGGVLASPAVATAQSPPHAEWRVVWADEFEGDRLDLSSWNVEVMPDPHNEELQYYTDRTGDAPGANVWLEGGHLVIEARSESFEHRSYTSGRINTLGKREFLYGRFEARIRLPSAVGTWPAFWMLGGNIESVGWPRCGEIDVMEGKGRLPSWTSGALHRGPDPDRNEITWDEYVLAVGDFQSEWHVFAVEWEPEEIRWYVDEALFQTVVKPDGVEPAYWPFDHGHRFFLVLNLAVGGWFDKDHPPRPDMPPQRLLVDYVRVYRSPPSPSG